MQWVLRTTNNDNNCRAEKKRCWSQIIRMNPISLYYIIISLLQLLHSIAFLPADPVIVIPLQLCHNLVQCIYLMPLPARH